MTSLSPLAAYRTESDSSRRIGLVAGWGKYPLLLSEFLRRRDYQVYCVGIADHADPALADLCTDFRFAGLARLGAHLRYFRRHGITQVTLAGKIHKVLFFRRGFWLRHLPDWTCVRTFFPHFITGKKNQSDDALLAAVVAGYQRGGVEILPATQLVPELLVKHGQLAGTAPTRAQQRDIEFGWQLAKQMGGLDVGQTVIVKNQAVLAVEAIEGTDQCIRRAAALCPAGGFTVVKVAKPQQDMRYDVPTIGIGTLQTLQQARASVLAIEAGRTIILEEAAVTRLAREYGISIVAVDETLVSGTAAKAA